MSGLPKVDYVGGVLSRGALPEFLKIVFFLHNRSFQLCDLGH